MSKSQPQTSSTKEPGFTGVARTLICYNNQGFQNYRIVTLYIENDKVVKRDFSDPYVNFEAGARMDLMNDHSLINLNNHWLEGKAFAK